VIFGSLEAQQSFDPGKPQPRRQNAQPSNEQATKGPRLASPAGKQPKRPNPPFSDCNCIKKSNCN